MNNIPMPKSTNITPFLGQPASSTTIISRAEATLGGFSRFYTGRPCKVGHSAARYVSNQHCVECNAEKSREVERLRCERDPSYRMYRSVCRRSGQAIKGLSSISDALGIGHSRLRDYIENKFTEGMYWRKYGQWEVDHIVPLSNAGSLEELIFLCHYKNLQPLWKRVNRMKGIREHYHTDLTTESTQAA